MSVSISRDVLPALAGASWRSRAREVRGPLLLAAAAEGADGLDRIDHFCRKYHNRGLRTVVLLSGGPAPHSAQAVVADDPGGKIARACGLTPGGCCLFNSDGERTFVGRMTEIHDRDRTFDRVLMIQPATVVFSGQGGVVSRHGPAEAMRGELVIEEPFADPADVDRWRADGQGEFRIADGGLHVLAAPAEASASLTMWYRRDLPADFWAAWDYTPHSEGEFTIVWFCARGVGGEDALSFIPRRNGDWRDLVSGEIESYHLAYRRGAGDHGMNLRKNPGKVMLFRNTRANPCLPTGRTCRVDCVKNGGRISIWIDGTLYIDARDDGASAGAVLGAGKIGFMTFPEHHDEIENLRVWAIDA